MDQDAQIVCVVCVPVILYVRLCMVACLLMPPVCVCFLYALCVAVLHPALPQDLVPVEDEASARHKALPGNLPQDTHTAVQIMAGTNHSLGIEPHKSLLLLVAPHVYVLMRMWV